MDAEKPPKGPVLADDGCTYLRDGRKGLYYRIDPETGKKLAGRPRKTLPVSGDKGLRVRDGQPKVQNYPENRAPREDNRRRYWRARDRRKRKHKNLEKKIKEQERRKERLEKQNDLLDRAPSQKEMTRAIIQLFEDHEFHPVEEMIEMFRSGNISRREKIQLLKALSDFYPKPKSIELDAEVKNQMQVIALDFSRASQKELKDAEQQQVLDAHQEPPRELTDEDYKEFEE